MDPLLRTGNKREHLVWTVGDGDPMHEVMIMIIFIRTKNTLQIMVTNKQSPNLRMPVESFKNLLG